MSDLVMNRFKKIRYKLVITNELQKIYNNYEKSMYGIEYCSNFSTKELLRILDSLKYKIAYVNSRDRTLEQLKEEFEFVEELNRRINTKIGEENEK